MLLLRRSASRPDGLAAPALTCRAAARGHSGEGGRSGRRDLAQWVRTGLRSACRPSAPGRARSGQANPITPQPARQRARDVRDRVEVRDLAAVRVVGRHRDARGAADPAVGVHVRGVGPVPLQHDVPRLETLGAGGVGQLPAERVVERRAGVGLDQHRIGAALEAVLLRRRRDLHRDQPVGVAAPAVVAGAHRTRLLTRREHELDVAGRRGEPLCEQEQDGTRQAVVEVRGGDERAIGPEPGRDPARRGQHGSRSRPHARRGELVRARASSPPTRRARSRRHRRPALAARTPARRAGSRTRPPPAP